ncbi:MAG: hypothetical protein MHMPM18_004034 [Marteilia pararefringens]
MKFDQFTNHNRLERDPNFLPAAPCHDFGNRDALSTIFIDEGSTKIGIEARKEVEESCCDETHETRELSDKLKFDKEHLIYQDGTFKVILIGYYCTETLIF